MARDPLAFVEDLDRPGCDARLHNLADQLRGHRVEVVVDINVIITSNPGALPRGPGVGFARKPLQRRTIERFQKLGTAFANATHDLRIDLCYAVTDRSVQLGQREELYSWLDGAEVPSIEQKIKQGPRFVTHRYRWLGDVPLRDGVVSKTRLRHDDAMLVNWLEIEIVDTAGKTTYRNSFVTDLPVTSNNVAELAACGRARWKIENESFNTLKTKGYNLEHNFGHGKAHLAATLATLNLLAFALHTVADLVDEAWKAARTAVGARKRFFEELRTITTYLLFQSWSALVETLRSGAPPPAVVRDG